MKTKALVIASVILILAAPALSDESEKNTILDAMEFPLPRLEIGSIINNPFFAVDIQRKAVDKKETNKIIKQISGEIRINNDTEKLYELALRYKDIGDHGNAVKYFKRYLNADNQYPGKDTEDNRIIQIQGDIYFNLSEIDLSTDRNLNLERSLLYLKKAIELNPDRITSWIKLGDCYLSLGLTTESLYCYNKVLEKNSADFTIYTRLQAAVFERDFLKLVSGKSDGEIENQPIIQGIDFDYIETVINNSSSDLKESLKLQHYIYLLRLLILKKDSYIRNNPERDSDFNKIFTSDEKRLLKEADEFLKTIKQIKIPHSKIRYLSGIVSFLKDDYKKLFVYYKDIPNEKNNEKLLHDEILFIIIHHIKDYNKARIMIEAIIKIKPEPEDYLLLAGLEFREKNLKESERLCNQSLKTDSAYAEAYSAISVISAVTGNYIAAEASIKKGISLPQKERSENKRLYHQMRLNEAAIALLKNEKEKAYLLLRSVISADNNVKALLLYNRYFDKK